MFTQIYKDPTKRRFIKGIALEDGDVICVDRIKTKIITCERYVCFYKEGDITLRVFTWSLLCGVTVEVRER